ncbi:hypothetical protein FPV21_03540 [Carnobacterium sp. PL12RED10]|uniref:hypothetical protein n=1 Tax=Carnobacterium sp. PL12RED10 TaxID=2592351 RepID=UPI0011ED7A47|nr:hypothetical protein [Carnobacterium sp. PL12RED10]KAF3301367.1 hypothetical protein FPV21_03540 [Carnobacterium sp. PL12RED10]
MSKFDITEWMVTVDVEFNKDEYAQGIYIDWDDLRIKKELELLLSFDIEIPWEEDLSLSEYMNFLDQEVFNETTIVEDFGLNNLEMINQADTNSETRIKFLERSHNNASKLVSAIFDYFEVPSGIDYEINRDYYYEYYKNNPLNLTSHERTINEIYEKVRNTVDSLTKKSLILSSLIATESLLKSTISSKVPDETVVTSFSSRILKDEIDEILMGSDEERKKLFRKLFSVPAPDQPWKNLRTSLAHDILSPKIEDNLITYTIYKNRKEKKVTENIDELFEKLINFHNDLKKIVDGDNHAL